MKKRIRKFALICVAALLCLSLTGCAALEEMRAAHAMWDKEGNIVLGEYTYRLLPAGEALEYLEPDFSNPDATIYVTMGDVPLLLSGMLGNEASISTDDVFLSVYDDQTYEYDLFCRTDRYDAIASRIQNGVEFTQYGYEYYNYIDEKSERYSLTEEQALAVETVIAAVASVEGEDLYNFDTVVSLELGTDDWLFRKPAFSLCLDGDTYCIAVETETGVALHAVPTDMNDIFLDIMAASMRAEQEWEDYYQEEYGDFDEDWDENSI